MKFVLKLIIFSIVLLGILNGIGLIINLLEKLPVLVILSGLFLFVFFNSLNAIFVNDNKYNNRVWRCYKWLRK